jgi:flagellar basal body-associated protein FliL
MLRHTGAGARLKSLQLLRCVTYAEGGLLSSAILYVAIVAIWAVVLIPRWLRRDTSPSASAPAPAPAPEEAQAEEVAVEEVAVEEVAVEEVAVEEVAVEEVAVEEVAVEEVTVPRPRRRADHGDAGASRRTVSEEGREHRRVAAARRRLLLLLIALAVGSGLLAYAGMAAWWVTVPPSTMLAGYLLLLREAAKADAERRSAEWAQARDRIAREARVAPPVPAVEAEAEVITISASHAPQEEIYDQYADAKLRAVGD